jgi:hypothetical protein
MQTDLRTPVSWLLGYFLGPSDAVERLRDQGSTEPQVLLLLGVRAMARRHYREAARFFEEARSAGSADPRLYELGVLAHAYGDEPAAAQELLDELAASSAAALVNRELWSFCETRFGLRRPDPMSRAAAASADDAAAPPP